MRVFQIIDSCSFSSISNKIRWISDRFRQMSPKLSVNGDVALFWLHCYFWSICQHGSSGIVQHGHLNNTSSWPKKNECDISRSSRNQPQMVSCWRYSHGSCPSCWFAGIIMAHFPTQSHHISCCGWPALIGTWSKLQPILPASRNKPLPPWGSLGAKSPEEVLIWETILHLLKYM